MPDLAWADKDVIDDEAAEGRSLQYMFKPSRSVGFRTSVAAVHPTRTGVSNSLSTCTSLSSTNLIVPGNSVPNGNSPFILIMECESETVNGTVNK